MSLPFMSLNAATAPGPGTPRDLEDAFGKHTIAVTVTGGPSAVAVDLEGSHDGVSWFNAGTPTLTGNLQKATIDSHLWRYVRANLTSLTGGTSPTVTATIASG